MFGLFKKKKPQVVTELLSRIDELKKGAPPNLCAVVSPVFDSMTIAVKTKWTPKNIQDYKRNIGSGDSHDAFICNYLVQSCSNRLESGRYHAYRGVLSPEGEAYHQLMMYAIGIMIRRGEYTETWAQDNLIRPILKGIREAG